MVKLKKQKKNLRNEKAGRKGAASKTASSLCQRLTHSGSKWIKPAKNKFTWCDFTIFFQSWNEFHFRSLFVLQSQNLSSCRRDNTPARFYFISGLKSRHFLLKNNGKKWSSTLFWNSLSPFRVAAAQCKKICPLRLNWPGRLAGISEGAWWISKYKILDHFSSLF